MAYNGATGQPDSRRQSTTISNGRNRNPVLQKTKLVNYNATTSDQLLSISGSASSTSTGESIPKAVEVENNGKVPIMVMSGYREWTSATADAGSGEGTFEYLHTMLMPGEVFSPPIRSVIRTGESDGTESKVQMLGTQVSNTAPDSNEYTDSTADTDDTTATDNVDNSASNTTVYLEPYTSATNCTANLFRVGDLIRIRDEVMEVTAIGDKSNLANNTLTVKRGLYGSTATTNTDDEDPVRFPFFNAYHDYDKYSVAQTDHDGKFKCNNFFGLGRALTGVQGIVPGSVAFKFYEPGYQAFGLSGITSNTNSGLAASTAYAFNITVDGGSTFASLSFTTDSSNLNFGGSNGIISKIQTALDAQFYTAGNLFEKKVQVGIVNGDVRFTSGSHLSTSRIVLAAPSSGTTPFGVGRIPAIGSINADVLAKLPDDVSYNRITYEQIPNSAAFCYDDGQGNLIGKANGTINYETGAIDFRNAPINAEFVYSCVHTSAFSGKLNEGTDERINSLANIYVNTPSQKWSGSVKLRTF
tara:strand:+ start:42 stop:1625 length:1584 start_codon:yes stop_codon:yes gene_type:complete